MVREEHAGLPNALHVDLCRRCRTTTTTTWEPDVGVVEDLARTAHAAAHRSMRTRPDIESGAHRARAPAPRMVPSSRPDSAKDPTTSISRRRPLAASPIRRLRAFIKTGAAETTCTRPLVRHLTTSTRAARHAAPDVPHGGSDAGETECHRCAPCGTTVGALTSVRRIPKHLKTGIAPALDGNIESASTSHARKLLSFCTRLSSHLTASARSANSRCATTS